MAPYTQFISELETILETVKKYEVDPVSGTLPRAERLDLLERVDALRRQIDDPVEVMFQQLTNYSQTSAARTMLQIGVFHAIPREGSISAHDLAAKLNANEEVLVRLMRILTTTGVFKSVSEDAYAHTKYSLAYIDGTEVDFYTLCIDEINPTALRIPQYLSSHPPNSILDPKLSPFSWDNNAEGKVFYQVLLDHPERLKRFNSAMTTQESQLPVLGMFPFAMAAKELTTKVNELGSQQDGAFIVDVAGGRGQSLLQIRREITDSLGEGAVKNLGKWILQDLKPVLDAIPEEELPGVEKVVIDFFEGQPVKNAHIYYLRRIMHNWQDSECRTILSHISAAMAPTSRLLIGELVVPESPENQPDKTVYWMDLCMLVIGGKERSQKEFETLLAAVGLKLVKIWRSKAGVQCVIECVKV